MEALARKKISKSHSQKNALVKHTDPRTDPMDVLFKGTAKFSDRQHSRFQRGDVLLKVRPESQLLKLFRVPVFLDAKLRDISVAGACFQAEHPIRTRQISLKLRFDDGAEFLLTARLLKRDKQNLHRVQFLEHNQTFQDHLLKTSLNLRFRDLD